MSDDFEQYILELQRNAQQLAKGISGLSEGQLAHSKAINDLQSQILGLLGGLLAIADVTIVPSNARRDALTRSIDAIKEVDEFAEGTHAGAILNALKQGGTSERPLTPEERRALFRVVPDPDSGEPKDGTEPPDSTDDQ